MRLKPMDALGVSCYVLCYGHTLTTMEEMGQFSRYDQYNTSSDKLDTIT